MANRNPFIELLESIPRVDLVTSARIILTIGLIFTIGGAGFFASYGLASFWHRLGVVGVVLGGCHLLCGTSIAIYARRKERNAYWTADSMRVKTGITEGGFEDFKVEDVPDDAQRHGVLDPASHPGVRWCPKYPIGQPVDPKSLACNDFTPSGGHEYGEPVCRCGYLFGDHNA